MKHFLFILLFIHTVLYAQIKDLQSGKFHILVDNATTNITPSSINGVERYDIRTGVTEGQGNLLLTVIEKNVFYFNAIPSLSNITQIGTTGAWNITIPTSITSQKAIFIPDKFTSIKFDATVFKIELSEMFFPVKIKNIATNNLICTIYKDGNIVWENQALYTASLISTTGLVQYTIN